MRDNSRLACHPYNGETHSGYIPPGTERRPRSAREKDENRAAFDFHPGMMLIEPKLQGLHAFGVRICRHILKLLDENHSSTQLASLPEGRHLLRIAEYVNTECSGQELYPPHRDFSLLTAFIGADMPGLQVKMSEGWYDPWLHFGDVLVGIGTPLVRFRSVFNALWHRVAATSARRLSASLFFELRDDVLLPHTGERYGEMVRRRTELLRETSPRP
jgi:isopenicillin N synthase-like dioxygenase